jgi:hypothetical protein
MDVSLGFSDADAWAQRHFGGCALGDARRSQRLLTLAAGWVRQPGASIPRLSAGHAGASKAAYRLLGRPEATPPALQGPHRTHVQQQIQAPGTYLLLEDTTELSWPRPTPSSPHRVGLGPVGSGRAHQQGVLLHSLLAAGPWPGLASGEASRPPLPLLGLLDQQFHLRQPAPAGEKKGVWARQHRARESALWTQSLQALPPPPPTPTRWVVVADRGADIYEHLLACQQRGLGFVVRAAQDRALLAAGGQAAGRLLTHLRSQPSQGQLPLSLRARPGQPAREVTLQGSWAEAVALRAPARPGRAIGAGPAVICSVVRVWEAAPQGLEWVLLCAEPVTTWQQACERVQQYASRWLIEEFHKALKSGLGAERLQLQTAPRLFAAVAVLSVVALALVGLREAARQQPTAPAEEAGLAPLELAVLRACQPRPVQTVGELYQAIASLGGHLGRRGDGPPGWQTLWLGWQTLRRLVEGVRLAPLILDP